MSEDWTTPFSDPYYPPLPAYYRNVRFQFVIFRTEPERVASFLPAPLEPSPDGLCVAIGLHVPFCTAYGSFNEAVFEQKCLFHGQEGWFCSHVWHDGPAGIAAGREIYGTPKIWSHLEVEMAERTMRTHASMGGLKVVEISSTMTVPTPATTLPPLTPAWRLKLIPRADGPGPAVKQLIDCTAATIDFEAHACYRGQGVVTFEPSPLC
ncbi:MAG: acetoacetate decarboxylase family protein, partial [candidate division Zixibacteria bacterium]|nr:acetoacetate decarboxylase family protein [candidate division Zixibacteria bacterium]